MLAYAKVRIYYIIYSTSGTYHVRLPSISSSVSLNSSSSQYSSPLSSSSFIVALSQSDQNSTAFTPVGDSNRISRPPFSGVWIEEQFFSSFVASWTHYRICIASPTTGISQPIRYSLAGKLSLFRRKLQLVRNPLQEL